MLKPLQARLGAGTGFGMGRSPSPDDNSKALVPVYEMPLNLSKEDEERYETARTRVMDRLMDLAEVVSAAGEMDPNKGAGIARENLRKVVAQIIESEGGYALGGPDRDRLVTEVTADVAGYGPLEPLLADDEISEIIVSTCEKISVEKNGILQRTPLKFRDEAALLRCCQRMAGRVQRQVNTASPMCDARLADGSRINIVIPPIAVDGTQLTIRKFRKQKLKMTDLVNYGTLTEAAAEVIRIIGRSAVNVLISGGTGSGKTTLLNCVTSAIDPRESIVTCEDTAELQLQQPNVRRLETRPRSSEGTAEVTMADLVRNTLRMKPDRIIVGEVRDAAAVDLIQVMNTGHPGSMGTVHANDPRSALARMEALMRTAPGMHNQSSANLRRDVSDALDIIIQTEQLPSGKRIVTNITEVLSMEGDVIQIQDIFVYDYISEILKSAIATKPHFYEKAVRIGEGQNLLAALHRSEKVSERMVG